MDRMDSRLTVVAAFARENFVDYPAWPNVATYLLIVGCNSDGLRKPAGVDLAPFDRWDTDALVPTVLAELEAPTMDEQQALRVVASCAARLASIGTFTDASPARILAQMYSAHGYPETPSALAQVYYAEEFLDCYCHDPTRDLRDALTELDAEAPAEVDVELITQFLGPPRPRTSGEQPR